MYSVPYFVKEKDKSNFLVILQVDSSICQPLKNAEVSHFFQVILWLQVTNDDL